MRKTKHWLVTASLLLCSIVVNAHDFEVDGIYYNITSSTDLTVEVTYRGDSYSAYADEYSGEVIIPTTVTNGGSTYGVTSIGDYAFHSCKTLTSVTISEGVTNIGMGAFYSCVGLTSITIPSNVVEIGYHAFAMCTSAKELHIVDSLEPLNNTPHPLGDYKDYFFEDSPIEYMYIGRDLKGYTFLYSYGDWRETLLTVEIGCGMTAIPMYMFDSCTKISSVALSNSITTIEGGAFWGCYLTNIQLPHSLEIIGSSAFQQSKLTSIVVPKSVTSIGHAAFHCCLELDNIIVEKGNPVYDSREDCNAIIETATNVLVRGCNNTVIPDGIVCINKNAFGGCTEMKNLTIPKSVTTIGNWAFELCRNLSLITCYSKIPPTCGTGTFGDVSKVIPVYVPESSIEDYRATDGWSEFTNFQAIPEINISLTDGEDFSQSEAEECDNIFYTRTFNNTNWQALYVPFEIPYENIKDDFEVAYINDTRQYDRDDDGMKEETVIEAFKITNGTLEANYPYLIRAKETGEKTITVTDAMLYTTEENSIDCSSVYDKYIFTGTYSRMSGTELTGCYALSGGIWQPVAEDASLGAFRFYLQIESRNGNAQAAQSIKMRIIGEETDDDATSIDDVESAGNEQIVYDLAGRRVANPTKGVYIVNGKKVLYN